MFNFKTIVKLFAALYVVFGVVCFYMVTSEKEHVSFTPQANFLKHGKLLQEVSQPSEVKDEIAEVQEIAKKFNSKKYIASRTKKVQVPKEKNPFYILGAYPDISHVYKVFKPVYWKPHLGLINENDYCTRVDLYNIEHPENIFQLMQNYFTDYTWPTLPRRMVMSKFGKIVMPHISHMMPDFYERNYRLDITINNFFVNMQGAMDMHHKLGTHFGCATQLYNHIPGHGNLIRKDSLLDSVSTYAEKYEGKEQCFHKNMYFPKFFRLYDKDECLAFFKMVHSKKYRNSLKKEPIQYLVKIGRGSHKGQGVFLLDDQETYEMEVFYNNGTQCGIEKKSWIVQGYITNPLLLDMGNKFDFRLYVTVASTNPLIVYYHDGFLRVSLSPFDKKSSDKATHLTNTFLAMQKIQDAEENNQKLNNMTEAQLKDYHLWTFEELQEYLLEIGRITDVNWLDNYLRPTIQRAIIHVIKMTSDEFLKQSNLYELLGLDFILDDNFDIWFIESNPSPLLTGTTQYKIYYSVLKDLMEIQSAYYRSRMSRVLKVVNKLREAQLEEKEVDLEELKAEYAEANKNRLEPKYKIPSSNSYTLIMDENLPGAEAYFGLIEPECVLRD